MVLYDRQFSNCCLQGIHYLGWWLIFPCYWFLNVLLSLCIRTSVEITNAEEDPCYQRPCILLFAVPILFALFLATAPIALIGLCFWVPVNHARKSYLYSYKPCKSEPGSLEYNNLTNIPSLTITSANVLLLPEAIARINNLSKTQHRARHVGRRIVESQNLYATISGSQTNFSQHNVDNQESGERHAVLAAASNISHVSSYFPQQLDFLCLQEVFDQRAGHTLAEILQQYFPHVVYDVGKYTWRNNYFIMNSGLLFASRYPLIDCDFRCFEHSANEDSLAAKGLLMVKVRIGSVMADGKQKEVVGYIANTHLQAEQGLEHNVRNCQLTESYEWLEVFKHTNNKPDEIVLFDVLCGDFNFDNVSQHCESHWGHKLMTLYKDPCKLGQGVDHDWTVGTELLQPTMHNKRMKCPEMMKDVLDDEGSRHIFVESTKSNEDETKNGKRRIDYILYNSSTPLEIENYSFVTNLASLTDHIPVAMTFKTLTREMQSSSP